ncbi:MAG: hypothetical protein H6732_20435 [Alphaproteobacteria bacterium]|nr:hypothetical protein [Alphaproteobacteria bacterium]
MRPGQDARRVVVCSGSQIVATMKIGLGAQRPAVASAQGRPWQVSYVGRLRGRVRQLVTVYDQAE